MSSRSTTRLPVARLELILAIVLLSAALSIRGKALLGAWYNNLASLALAVDWQGPGEELGSPGCTTWVASSAAAPAVELALLLDPENRRTRLNAARVAWLGGDCETALDLWSTLESSDSIAHLEHANAVHALGREEEAQALYGQISGVTDYLRVRGERAQALGDTEAALGWYELSMAAAPTLETTQRLAALYVGRQQPAAATAAWQKLAEAADGSDPTYWWAVGQSAELQEDWRAAANAYDRGVDQAADPCRFWEREAASLERLGDWARVEHISRAALDRCPDLLWPYLRLGDALRRQADYTGALQWYGQAELLWPDDVHPKYLIGVLWYDQDDWEQAEAYFRRSLELDPDHLGSTYYLAWSLYLRGDPQGATGALSRAIELHGGQPWQFAVLLGDWQLERGARLEAIAAYEQALAWHPGDDAIQQRIESARKRGQ